MANQLDLEEQEQLDQLKHFWQQYGNFITAALFAILAGLVGWNGYQYWQRTQATQASSMFDEMQRAVASKDAARVERSLTDMKEKFGSTTYAQQGALLAAKSLLEAGKVDASKSALAWVAEKSPDEAYRAIAKLRLAGLLVDAKALDDALAQLAGTFPDSFAPLVNDRRGDILSLQGKKSLAKDEYLRAYQAMDERSEYRPLVEFKLNALGVDPGTNKPNAVAAAASSVKP